MRRLKKNFKILTFSFNKRFFQLFCCFLLTGCSLSEFSWYLTDFISKKEEFPLEKLSHQMVSFKREKGYSAQESLKKTFFLCWTSARTNFPNLKNLYTFETRQENLEEKKLLSYLVFKRFQENQLGIIIRNTEMHSLPIDETYEYHKKYKNYFYTLALSEPVRIKNYSNDNNWCLIETNIGFSGWVRATDVIKVSEDEAKSLMEGEVFVCLSHNYPIFNQEGGVVGYTRFAQVFLRQNGKFILPQRNEYGKISIISLKEDHGLDLIKPGDMPLSFLVNKLLILPYRSDCRFNSFNKYALIKSFFDVLGVFYILSRTESFFEKVRKFSISLNNVENNEKKLNILKKQPQGKTIFFVGRNMLLFLGKHEDDMIVLDSNPDGNRAFVRICRGKFNWYEAKDIIESIDSAEVFF